MAQRFDEVQTSKREAGGQYHYETLDELFGKNNLVVVDSAYAAYSDGIARGEVYDQELLYRIQDEIMGRQVEYAVEYGSGNYVLARPVVETRGEMTPDIMLMAAIVVLGTVRQFFGRSGRGKKR